MEPIRLDPLNHMNQIIQLRQKVLHPLGPPERVIYKKDMTEAALHMGVFKKDQLIATGTLIAEDEEEAPSTKSLRIRGMAVDPSHQGQGLGQKILSSLLNQAKSQYPFATQIWCNARLKAFNLYTRQGFQIFEPEFDVPGSGPHKRLRLQLHP